MFMRHSTCPDVKMTGYRLNDRMIFPLIYCHIMRLRIEYKAEPRHFFSTNIYTVYRKRWTYSDPRYIDSYTNKVVHSIHSFVCLTFVYVHSLLKSTTKSYFARNFLYQFVLFISYIYEY